MVAGAATRPTGARRPSAARAKPTQPRPPRSQRNFRMVPIVRMPTAANTFSAAALIVTQKNGL
jgi:hypothetical protein